MKERPISLAASTLFVFGLCGTFAAAAPAFPTSSASLLAGLVAQTAPDQAGQTAQPASRALPSPLPSPPFPGSDWLGFPLIGAPYSVTTGPLQKLLGKKMTDEGFLLYGWVNPSYNYSSSKNSNLPLTYALVPNRLELDQAVIIFEKQPDTVQTDHQDWGFRFLNLYGIDYRYTAMKGIFSDQLLKRNELYGYDPVEMYGMLYYPKVAEGMVVRFGRYISPPDIEAQLTPDNYVFSHSQMFSIDPYTFIGVQATIRYSKQWEVQFGIHDGNDMAPWTKSAAPNLQALVRWASLDGNDAFWGGVNSIGDGKFRDGHDNLQHIVGTWGHKFNEKYHMMTEAYYMWQFDAAKGGDENDGPVQPFGGGGGIGQIIPGRSESIGAVNYFQILLGKNDYISIRNDYLGDREGQRTGYATDYYSATIGLCHYFSPYLILRPEIRYDHAFEATPFDNGTRRDQWTIAADLIVRF